MMFKNKILRNTLLIILCVGALFLFINTYFVYPYFSTLFFKSFEDEAVRVGKLLTHMHFTGKTHLSKENIDPLEGHIEKNLAGLNLAKLKIFSSNGEVIYSTDKKDIGKINHEGYFQKIIAAGMPYTKVVNKDSLSQEGQIFTADVVETYVPILSGGKFIGAFEIYYNITEKRQALDIAVIKASVIPVAMTIGGVIITIIILLQLEKTMNRQKEIERELKVNAEKLQQSNRELQDFAHIASHDLQEPLRKITAFGDRLKTKYADALGDQGCDYLERMQNAAGRMQNLIEGLLTYSRVTTKAKPFETVDLSGVIEGVLSDLEMSIHESGGHVKIGELPTLNADPLQMQQLLQNLISNALKFHKKDEQPYVKVSASPVKSNGNDPNTGDSHQITVEDNGIGFDEKYTERIFGVFQRLHGRKDYQGSGIGLSVCRRITERHGGNITAKSTPGQGTKFIINLPAEHNEGGNNV